MTSCNRDIIAFRHGSVLTQLTSIENLQSSVIADKIAIALNLSNFQLYSTRPNISSSECRWVLSLIALALGDPRVLVEMVSLRIFDDDLWVHSKMSLLSDPLGPQLLNASCSISHNHQIHAISEARISLDVFDLSNCKTRLPGRRTVERCRKLLSLMIKYLSSSFPARPGWTFMSNPMLIRDHDLLAAMVACSFDCGLDWMIEQVQHVPQLSEYTRSNINEGRVVSLMSDAVSAGLIESKLLTQKRLKTLTEVRLEHLIRWICLIIIDIGYRMNTETDVRSDSHGSGRSYRMEAQPMQCCILQISHRSSAILIRPEAQPSQNMCALPVALSNPTCSLMRRLWCLQPDGSRRNRIWSVSALHYLINYTPLEEVFNASDVKLKSVDIKIG